MGKQENMVDNAFRLLRADLAEIQSEISDMNYGKARDKIRMLIEIESWRHQNTITGTFAVPVGGLRKKKRKRGNERVRG